MVLESTVPEFFQWLPGALTQWLVVVLVLGGAITAFSLIVSTIRNGPAQAVVNIVNLVADGLRELLLISPRRVSALARLAIKESLHRRVLAVFGLFILLLLFAGWYLDPTTNDPTRLYLSVVLTATSYLVLLLVLFLSVFSLPADLANRTIHTVVTKPVRFSELVLGRVLGFSLVGTGMLAAIGTLSYFFVVRGLSHAHEVVETTWEDVEADDSPDAVVRRGETTKVQNHRHEVLLTKSGTGRTDVQAGHWHEVHSETRGGKTVYVTGPPRGQLRARVPVYGKLSFRDRAGKPAKEGINRGNEWTYRSYIDGASLASATWTFEGVTPERFSGGLPLEMTLSVFRTHKGDMTRGILGSIVLRNPDNPEVRSAPRNFLAKEYEIDVQNFPRELEDAEGRPLDLFRDLAPDGRLDVEVTCLESGQLFGMAQPDAYLRAHDASFTLNFAKAYVGIWQQMLLVICFGVMFSTFLNSAVAMLATMATLLAGFFSDFVVRLATDQLYGGGPVESFYRIVTQMNLTTELDPGLLRTSIEMYDSVLRFLLRQVSFVLPDFTSFNSANYVANGFDIPANLLWVRSVTALAFLIPVFVLSYFLLKSREVAR